MGYWDVVQRECEPGDRNWEFENNVFEFRIKH
jgi:hypothetical protein